MSKRLHIPFDRHTKTTRRPRWVVSLSLLFFVFCVLLFSHLINLWFTRNTVFAAAPENTQIAIQILINKKTLPIIEPILNTIPLISNRSLTLTDVQGFTNGEMGWFFNEDGTRSIAVRTKKENIPAKMLDANQIVVQFVKPNVFLLSEKLQPIKGTKTLRSFKSLLPLFKQKLGQFSESGQKPTTILANKNGISIDLNGEFENVNVFEKNEAQENAMIIMSIPLVWNGVEQQFQTLFPNNELLNFVLSQNGLVVIKNRDISKFLIVSQANLNEKDRTYFIQTTLALKNPQIVTKTLVDQTQIQEFISDPSLISVEERMIEGNVFLRASNEAESMYLNKSGKFIFSNDEDMVRNWLKRQSNKQLLKLCDANVVFVSLKEFVETNSFTTYSYSNNILRLLSDKFTVATIEKRWNSTKLHLCY